jgi:hypothetical protein
MAETFTWSGSKIPFSYFLHSLFLFDDGWGKKMGMEQCFAFSFPRREEEKWQGSIEIREEEHGSIAKAFCAKDGAKQSKQIRFTELS